MLFDGNIDRLLFIRYKAMVVKQVETKVWVVDNVVDKTSSYPQILQAAALLRANEVVAFPTETVYGLGANAASTAAVKKNFSGERPPER